MNFDLATFSVHMPTTGSAPQTKTVAYPTTANNRRALVNMNTPPFGFTGLAVSPDGSIHLGAFRVAGLDSLVSLFAFEFPGRRDDIPQHRISRLPAQSPLQL